MAIMHNLARRRATCAIAQRQELPHQKTTSSTSARKKKQKEGQKKNKLVRISLNNILFEPVKAP
jgi:hypothetical protein